MELYEPKYNEELLKNSNYDTKKSSGNLSFIESQRDDLTPEFKNTIVRSKAPHCVCIDCFLNYLGGSTKNYCETKVLYEKMISEDRRKNPKKYEEEYQTLEEEDVESFSHKNDLRKDMTFLKKSSHLVRDSRIKDY